MRLRSCLIALLPAAVALSLCSCSSEERQNAAKEVGAEFFAKFSVPDEATKSEWGMTDYVVFGPNGSTGGVMLKQTAESPEEYELTISFWCKGTDPKGEFIKRQRELCVTIVAPEENGPFQVKKHDLRVDEPLGFMRQAGTWLGLSFLLPVLLFFLSWLLFDATTARVIAGLLSTPIAGFLAYRCFDSGWAVPLGIIVYLIAGLLLAGLIAAIAAAAQS